MRRIWGLLLLLIPLLAVIGIAGPNEEIEVKEEINITMKFMAMAISVSIGSISAAYAVARTGVSAIASVTEKPEVFGKVLIFVGLAEGIAIYGLLIAFLIWIS